MLTESLPTPSHGEFLVTSESNQGPDDPNNLEDFKNNEDQSSSSATTIITSTNAIDENVKKEVILLMREKLTLLLRDESNYLSTQSLLSSDNSLHKLMFLLMATTIGWDWKQWDEKRFNHVTQSVAKAMSRLALFGQPIISLLSSTHNDPLSTISCMALSRAGHRMPITTIAGPGGCWIIKYSDMFSGVLRKHTDEELAELKREQERELERLLYVMNRRHDFDRDFVGFSVPIDDFREHRKFTRWVESNPFNHNWVTTALLELHYIEHIETYNRVRREAEDNFVLKKEHIERVIHNYGRGWYDAENTVTITEIQSLDLFMNYKQHAVSVSFIDDYHLLMTTCIQQRAHNWNEVNALQAAIIADDLHQVRLLIELGWDTHTEISNEFIKSPEMRTLLEEHFELPLEASHASTIGNSVVAQVWGLYEEDHFDELWIDYPCDCDSTMEEVD